MKTREEIGDFLKPVMRGVQMMLSDKFAEVCIEPEYSIHYQAWIINAIGKAMGETWDSFEYPVNWKRFLKRKDCPQYMKETRKVSVSAYYPKIKFPQYPHWITFT